MVLGVGWGAGVVGHGVALHELEPIRKGGGGAVKASPPERLT